jgi:hypothetical protein
MRRVPLSVLAVGGETTAAIQANDGIHGVARRLDGTLVAFGPGSQFKSLEAVGGRVDCWYGKPAHFGAIPAAGVTEPRVREGSRTARAVALVKAGQTAHAAAQAVGVDPAAVYRALKRGTRTLCPCCGRPQ